MEMLRTENGITMQFTQRDGRNIASWDSLINALLTRYESGETVEGIKEVKE